MARGLVGPMAGILVGGRVTPHLHRRLLRCGFAHVMTIVDMIGAMSGDRNSRLIHGVCTLYGQWLPGDERGWRSRDHRVHSSGDYRDPPPEDEHAGLRRHARNAMKSGPQFLRPEQYPHVGRAFIGKLLKLGSSVRCLSCGSKHLHVLYDSIAADARNELGRAKQYASLKLPDHRGRLWGKGAKIVVVRDIVHARRVWKYILDHAIKEGAWTWRYDRDEAPD